ncbi:DUF1993 domain-containing protein [Caulobacter sp. DWP3-1-3b2]|uniref:DUF1993 domain-containing protein n=1 Tax=Caulobacter sp. DWP3-1-3b2 TaxID=2804643 RepID=UPI003CF134E8
MSTSLYDLTVPVLVRALRNLSAILKKGEAFAKETGMDPKDLIEARLFPDMGALASQIQRASDSAKGCVVRIGGVENLAMADTETTFDELQARIAATIAFLENTPREAMDGKEGTQVVLKLPNGEFPFTATNFALGFVLPNVFFHVTTAYGILRHKGVPLGKLDYLGGL